MQLLPIHTPRLTLRRFSDDDLADFQAYRCDPAVAKFQGWQPTSDEVSLAFLREQAEQTFGKEGQWLQIAITETESERLAGDLGICWVDARRGEVSLGFSLGRQLQRRGYANEAVSALVSKLFEAHGVQSIVAMTDTRNRAANALLGKLGFENFETKDATFRGVACREHHWVLSAPP